MKTKTISYILTTLLLISSCGTYKKYVPVTKVDDKLFGEDYECTDTSSIASLSRNEMFSDSYLQKLIDTALVRNSDLNMALLRLEQSEAALQRARLAYLPSIGLNADGGLGKWNGNSSKTYSLGGTASWATDFFGRMTAAKRGAMEAMEANLEYSHAVESYVIAMTASTYYMLLMLDEQIIIGQESLTAWTETVKSLKALMKAGRANETAVLQAEAERSGMEAALLSMYKSLEETETQMCRILAWTPRHIERGSLEEQKFPKRLSAGLPVSILSQRPDVRQAEHKLAQAFYAVGEAKAAFYPSINLSGIIGWTNNAGGVIINPGQWIMNAVGNLAMPIFNRSINSANLKEAKAGFEIASINFRQKLLESGNEVNNALTSYQTADKRISLNESAVDSLTEAMKKTEVLMAHSSATYLDVLTARKALLGARQNLAQDRFERISAVIALYHALGGR